jgi:formylglycine-generating enzyme required for sulfatase activity
VDELKRAQVAAAVPPPAAKPAVPNAPAPPPQRQPVVAAPPNAPAPARCDGVEAQVGNERRCLKPKESFKDCPDCPEMVVIPAGEFTMGSPSNEEGHSSIEGPQHKVGIAKPFGVGRFEVTFAEWDACVAAGGCKHKPSDQGWGRGKRPVIDVSWNDAKEYVAWLAKKTGRTYRLLSEAEWEYVARAGTTTPFSTGRTITTDQANFNGNSTYGGSAKGVNRGKTIEVGSLNKPNAFGLHDMHGNVWEWVEDCYEDTYAGAASDGRAVADTPSCSRVLRGGSWYSNPQYLRSAFRLRFSPVDRDNFLGFRVARTL